MAKTQLNKIVVQVDGSKELRELVSELNKIAASNRAISKSSKNTADSLAGLQLAFAGVLGLNFAGELIKATDTLQLLRDRINAFTGDAGETKKVFNDIFQAAKFTKTSVASLSETFNRLALSTKDLGLTTDQVLAFSVALQQTFRIGGASVAEMTGSIIQLSQGLSSGQLRGQELRSVLEANVVVAEALAKALNVQRGQLIKEAEKGKITAAVVIKALAMEIDNINKKAGNLNVTFEQTGLIIKDQFYKRFLEIRDRLGITKFLEGATEAVIYFKDAIIALGAAFAALSVIAAGAGTFKLLTTIFGGLTLKITIVVGAIAALVAGLTYLYLKWPIISTAIQLGFAKLNVALIEFSIYMQKGVRELESFINDKAAKALNFFRELSGLEPIEFKLLELSDDNSLKNLEQDLVSAKMTMESIGKEFDVLNEAGNDIDFPTFLKQKFEEMIKALENTATALGTFGQINKVFRQFGYVQGASAKLSAELITLQTEVNASKIAFDEYYVSLVKLQGFFREDTYLGRLGDILSAGTVQYLQGLKGINAEIVDAISSTWKNLEDQLLNFIKKGKFEFKDFAQFILDELNRILIRYAIVRPLAQGLQGGLEALGGSFTGGGSSGQVSNIISSGATLNPGNATYAMGGSGKAAPVNLTINNNAGVEVSTQESVSANGTRSLDVIIAQKTQEAFAAGKMDKTLSSMYGIKRKGL